MHPGRRIALFFAGFALIYAMLMAAWPFVGHAYAIAFRGVGAALFSDFGHEGTVRIEPLTSADSSHDTTLVLRNYRDHKQGEVEISSRSVGYLPTAMLSALVLATPLRLRKRVSALCIGLALIHVFIAARLWIVLLAAFSDPNSVAMLHPGPLGRAVLAFFLEVTYTSLFGAFVGPIIIWILVCLRPGNLRMILSGAGDSETPVR